MQLARQYKFWYGDCFLEELLITTKTSTTEGKRLTDLCLMRLIQAGKTLESLKHILPVELLDRMSNILKATSPKFGVQANGMVKLLEYTCGIQ
jgi:hypothetical protein